jgi:hypothetical protein
MPLPCDALPRQSGLAGSYPSRAMMSVAKIVNSLRYRARQGSQVTNDHLALRAAGQQRWTRPTDRTPLGASEDNRGVRRYSAGEMNAEVASVLLQSAMNFVAIFTMGNHAALVKRRRCIQLEIFQKQPLIGVWL